MLADESLHLPLPLPERVSWRNTKTVLPGLRLTNTLLLGRVLFADSEPVSHHAFGLINANFFRAGEQLRAGFHAHFLQFGVDRKQSLRCGTA